MERPASRAIQSSLSTPDAAEQEDVSSFILDGQQRLTSIMRASVTGQTHIEFSPITESFRVTAARPTTSIRAISVAEVFRKGPEAVLNAHAKYLSSQDHATYLSRLQRLRNIYNRIVPVETLKGYSYEEVTDVFIRVNSRGTRLKAAELAIAEVAYRLPGLVSRELERYTEQLASQGWEFSVQLLLRLVASIATGRVGFKGLGTITDEEFIDAWKRLPPALDAWLSLLTSRLSISTSDILVGVNNHIVPVVWFANSGDRVHDDRLIEWFVHSSVWSRYSGPSESNLDQDLKELLAERRRNPFVALMERVRQGRPSLRVSLRDVEGAGQKSPLSLLMYLAMVRATKDDLLTGTVSPTMEPGKLPRAIARPVFTGRTVRPLHPSVSAAQLANMVFVTQASSNLIKNQDIARFFESIPATRLNAFALPTDPTLWRAASYPAFIKQRSRLLVEAMNDVIRDLATNRAGWADTPKTLLTTARSGPRVDITRHSISNRDTKLSFDEARLAIFHILEQRILELDPTIERVDRTTYLGFKLAKDPQPFATVARLRKTSLSWVIDCNIKDIKDPQKWCRDVTEIGKHGYGSTQFVIEGPHQVPYAMDLIRQVFRMKS
jgi:predicted transport protein